MRRLGFGFTAAISICAAISSEPALAQAQQPSVAASIPTGAVMAFDLPACPQCWSLFKPATARIIIGAGQDFDPGYATGDDGQRLTPKNYRDFGGAESHTLIPAELPKNNPMVVVQKTGTPPGQPTPITNLMVTTVSPCLDSGYDQISAVTWGFHPGDQHVEFNPHIDTGGTSQPIKARSPYLALTYCRKN